MGRDVVVPSGRGGRMRHVTIAAALHPSGLGKCTHLRVLALAVRPLLAIKLALPGLGPKLGCELRGLRGSSGKVLLLRGYIHGLLLLRGLLLRGII
eukprot:scaffold51598_cov13-Tisochrysis_lutea.AAC.1